MNKKFTNFVLWWSELFTKDKEKQLIISGFGIAGEAGEVVEVLKKYIRDKRPESYLKKELILELGDVLHNVVSLAALHGWTIEDVMQANMDKLEERYKRMGPPK